MCSGEKNATLKMRRRRYDLPVVEAQVDHTALNKQNINQQSETESCMSTCSDGEKTGEI